MDQNFVHLHLHTEYSLLDGFAQIDRVVKYAKDLGMPALAISDHGTMFGVIDFYRACKDEGVKPIIGVEAYLAEGKMTERIAKSKAYHMLLLARNRTGYQNLMKLSSAAQLEGYYYRPRIDKDFLAAHAAGLIATSGCLAAEIPRMVLEGREQEAKRLLGWYQDIFGKDNFFLELQGHNIPELTQLNRWLLQNAEYANVPLVATNDVHYVLPADYDAHDTLLCIQTSTTKAEKDRMMMSGGNTYYLRNQQEMWSLFGTEAPDALMNTLVIAEMCEDPNLDDKEYHLPIFPVPPDFRDAGEFLRYLCEKGLRWRYGERAELPKYQDRLDYELQIIHNMGFDTYFLIVWDLCEFAHSQDIWWNVRGSGAGSMVAYCLGITALDPLENSLLFERFLNPGRVSMPDFDLDYPEDRRFEMIEYCTRKYGEDKVAAIITFGTLGAKAAIRDVGRALGFPLNEVNRIAGLVPTTTKPPKIEQLLGMDEEKPELVSNEFVELYQKDKQARNLIDTAMRLEGTPRHVSTHAAGIIVADRPLVEYIPLHRPTKASEAEDDNPVKMVTQFPMETAESIGLLKIDFLGLSTLTIMRRACALIEQHHGIRYDMSNIPYKPDPENPEVTRMVEEMFEMLGRGESVGVFQLESSGMRQTLKGMRPKTFEHIIAAISLYRPGPMQFIEQFNRRLHGEEKVEYLHPALESIIGNTYGIITYQEQLMQIAAELFGYGLGEADLMRRAVSKKKEKDLKLHRDIFIERGPERGVDPATAGAIFDQIEFFANYGFNKSHAADYAVITCQTAFLKCHFPHEYMTALMSVYYDDSTKVGVFASDSYRMGINVLPPNVNYSLNDFNIETVEDGKRHIRYGLSSVKNVGHGPIEHIIEARNADGKFHNLDDFLMRCDMRIVGKRALESLIYVGALDDFGDRAILANNIERLMHYSVEYHKKAESGQISMFDLFSAGGQPNATSIWGTLEKSATPADKREQLRWEKDLLGFYVTSHPLQALNKQLQQLTNTADLREEPESYLGKSTRMAGLVANIRSMTTKTGDPMAIIQLEDMHGVIPCVLFPRTWGDYRHMVIEDNVIIVRGKVDTRNDELQIVVEEVSQDLTVTYAEETIAPTVSNFQALNTPILEDDLYDDGYLPPSLEEPPFNDDYWPVPVQRNGNGHNHRSQEKAKQTPMKTRQRLVVTLNRTQDIDSDNRKLRIIHGIASSYPGRDELYIRVRTPGIEQVGVIKFPDLTIGVCDELIGELLKKAKINQDLVEVKLLD